MAIFTTNFANIPKTGIRKVNNDSYKTKTKENSNVLKIESSNKPNDMDRLR